MKSLKIRNPEDSDKKSLSEDQELFLNILNRVIHNEQVSFNEEIDAHVKEILYISSDHFVYPLIVNALYSSCYEGIKIFEKRAIDQTIRQAAKTASFVMLYKKMSEKGLKPLILKGMVCRNLYAEPELRPSVDEDLLIKPGEIRKYHQFFTEHGFILINEEENLEKDSELSYKNKENGLYLEIHRYLFPQDEIFSDLNELFEKQNVSMKINAYGVEMEALDPTDHLLYMLAHAYKHLIYSGIGIRQICDITLFSEKYGALIDWKTIADSCRKLHLEIFLKAVLKICHVHLGMRREKTCITTGLINEDVDEMPLLEDIITGGIYGAKDENRLHSANMTLDAVYSQKKGKRRRGIRKSLFPSFSYMSENYPYLKTYPILLPWAWAERIIGYLKKPGGRNNSEKIIEIGKKRIDLLKKYGLV